MHLGAEVEIYRGSRTLAKIVSSADKKLTTIAPAGETITTRALEFHENTGRLKTAFAYYNHSMTLDSRIGELKSVDIASWSEDGKLESAQGKAIKISFCGLELECDAILFYDDRIEILTKGSILRDGQNIRSQEGERVACLSYDGKILNPEDL